MTTSVEAASVVFGNRDVIYEHWLYLPMVGFALFLPAGLLKIFKSKRIVSAVLLAVLTVSSVMTVRRNTVWKNETSLIQDALKKSPGKAYVYYAAGCIYMREGRRRQAEEYLQRAIMLYTQQPECPQNFCRRYLSGAYNNLGLLMVDNGLAEQAKVNFRKAVEVVPNNPEAWNNLGIVYYREKDYRRAAACLERAMILKEPEEALLYYLGNSYIQLGDEERGQALLLRAKIKQPDNS